MTQTSAGGPDKGVHAGWPTFSAEPLIPKMGLPHPLSLAFFERQGGKVCMVGGTYRPEQPPTPIPTIHLGTTQAPPDLCRSPSTTPPASSTPRPASTTTAPATTTRRMEDLSLKIRWNLMAEITSM